MRPSDTKITPFQLAMLLIPGIGSTAILGLPSITYTGAKQDAWMAPLAAAPLAALVIWIAGRLACRFPEETFIEYAPKVIGAIPGKIAGILLLWYFFHLDAAIAREFSDFLIATSLPRTPQAVIIVPGALAAGLAVRYGPEILGRLGELFTPLAVIMVSTVVLLAMPEMDFSMVKPVLENGVGPVATAAFMTQAFLGQFVLLVVLLPSLTKPKLGIRSSYWALVAIVVLLAVMSVTSIASFGPITGHFTWPVFEMARVASIGAVLSRIDPIVIAFWIGGSNLKLAVHLYATTVCFAQVFGLSDYRSLAFPMSVLVAAYSVGHVANLVEHGHMLTYFWAPYTQVFQLIIPALVLGVAALRGMGVSRP